MELPNSREFFIVFKNITSLTCGLGMFLDISRKNKLDFPTQTIKYRDVCLLMDIDSSVHSKWNCKNHIVFAPKLRR
jgi:hypothetical protein